MKNDFSKVAARIENYANLVFPHEAGKRALGFIAGNFRSQSWEGTPWKRRKKGSPRNQGRALLVDTAKLKRGNRMVKGKGVVKIVNDVPYAAAHNNGFYGTVTVSGHKRRLYGRFRVSSIKTQKTSRKRLEKGTTAVSSHSRKMRIPRRQFAPTAQRPSPTLEREIRRMVQLDIMKILKSF